MTISVYQGAKTDKKTFGVGLTSDKAGCCGYGKMFNLFIVATSWSDSTYFKSNICYMNVYFNSAIRFVTKHIHLLYQGMMVKRGDMIVC